MKHPQWLLAAGVRDEAAGFPQKWMTRRCEFTGVPPRRRTPGGLFPLQTLEEGERRSLVGCCCVAAVTPRLFHPVGDTSPLYWPHRGFHTLWSSPPSSRPHDGVPGHPLAPSRQPDVRDPSWLPPHSLILLLILADAVEQHKAPLIQADLPGNLAGSASHLSPCTLSCN